MTAARSSRPDAKHRLNVLKKAVKGLGGKALALWRKELMEDLGGPEAVSTQKQALIDLAVRTKLLLDSIDTWLLNQPSLVNARRRAVLPVVLQRQHLAESLARSLTQLGLERRTKTTAAAGGDPAPAGSMLEQLAEKLLPLGQEDFIKALATLMPRTVGESLESLEGENRPGGGTQTIIEHDGISKNQHSISKDGSPLVAANTAPTLEELLDRLESWTVRARALCEQSAQHPEPPALARHLAAGLAAEVPVAALLDAARDISSPARSHMLAVLSRGAKLMDGSPVVLETKPLDEATGAALAPLLEAAHLLAALDKLTADSVQSSGRNSRIAPAGGKRSLR